MEEGKGREGKGVITVVIDIHAGKRRRGSDDAPEK
jgi:hypothetical protein